MPYIKVEKRNKITPVHGPCGRIEMQYIDCAGDLNYAFTMLAIDYIVRKGHNYQSINDIVGAFTCAKDEFQRRITAIYENVKINSNGDVYPKFETPVHQDIGVQHFNGS